MAALTHMARLVAVGWTLARYGAVTASDGFVLPASLKALRRLLALVPMRGDMRGEVPGTRLARALAALGPGFVKVGQALATRPDLVGEKLAADLAHLQDQLPAFPAETAIRIIESELQAPLDQLFKSFDAVPVAAASIAQVHQAVTSDGRKVAVKVRRPGVEARFARDLAAFRWAATKAEKLVPASRRLRPVDTLNELERTIQLELDLRREAAAAEELAERSRTIPGYRVPAPDWLRTSKQVLTTEWIDGISVRDTAGLTAAGIDHKALAHTLVSAFLTQVTEGGFFHADLHQGNLLVTADGTLVALDFGIMGRLTLAERRYLAEILHGFITGDYYANAKAHFDAGYVPEGEDIDEFALALRAIGAPIKGLAVKDISIGRLLVQLFDTTRAFNMQTQPQLILLQKTMVTVEGIALTLDPDINMWQVSEPLIARWMAKNSGPAAVASGLKDLASLIARRLPELLVLLEKRLEMQKDPA